MKSKNVLGHEKFDGETYPLLHACPSSMYQCFECDMAIIYCTHIQNPFYNCVTPQNEKYITLTTCLHLNK